MTSNAAAWLPRKHGDLEVGSAPYTAPGAGEITIRNRAVAINPVDWMKPEMGDFLFPWIRYPFVLGEDVAGEVVEVGADVSRFRVGDRVIAHAVGTDKQRNRAAEGAFQEHTVALAHMSAPIPHDIPYERAAVLPLALSTAACGLFQDDHLGLHHPALDPVPNGKTVVVWGGSTSVGNNAIQLAVAAGYRVITAASPKNFDRVSTWARRAHSTTPARPWCRTSSTRWRAGPSRGRLRSATVPRGRASTSRGGQADPAGLPSPPPESRSRPFRAAHWASRPSVSDSRPGAWLLP